eukprot:1812792-Prymnesium_polylepis.1
MPVRLCEQGSRGTRLDCMGVEHSMRSTLAAPPCGHALGLAAKGKSAAMISMWWSVPSCTGTPPPHRALAQGPCCARLSADSERGDEVRLLAVEDARVAVAVVRLARAARLDPARLVVAAVPRPRRAALRRPAHVAAVARARHDARVANVVALCGTRRRSVGSGGRGAGKRRAAHGERAGGGSLSHGAHSSEWCSGGAARARTLHCVLVCTEHAPAGGAVVKPESQLLS